MASETKGFGVGARLPRKEDLRFLRGRGTYVADVRMPGMLDLAFVRSPMAHGRLRGVEKPAGLEDSVFTVDDLPRLKPVRVVPDIPGYKASDHWPLAKDKVRFAGDCVAACIAPSRGAAEDLAQQVMVDVDPLPAIVDGLQARNDPPSLVHDEWGDNVYVQRDFSGGDIDSVRNAPVVVTRHYRMNRQATVPMETRAALAFWDDRLDELVLYLTSQIPHLIRVGLSEALGLPERQIHVISPDVGGGFGGKARLMPEEIVVCAIALQTRKPIRWVEDSREHLLSASQAREHIYTVTAYADARGIIQGIDADLTVDGGAYALWHTGPVLEAGMAARNLPGPYRMDHYRVRTWTVATNKAPLGVLRGVARPGSCFAIERTIDEVAREVGRDPLDVRLDNMVTADMMPFTTTGGMKFDNGDYPESVRRAAKLVDYDGIRARASNVLDDGRLIGVGIAAYSEQSAHGADEWVKRRTAIICGYETAKARMDPDGSLIVSVAVHSHGQGMETTLAQIAHEELGIDFDKISVRFGDTATSPFGMGTFASRSIVMGGGAVSNVCIKLREKMAEIAAHLLQCETDQLTFADDEVKGPSGSVTLAEISRVAHIRQEQLPEGVDPVLDETATWEPVESEGVFSYATQVAVVALDPDSGAFDLIDYAIVEDCGTVVNPMIVDGQIAGGVVMGIGTAMYEEVRYGEDGQPLATNYAEYLMPTAPEMPHIKIGHMATPATLTRYGMKGMGEGGAIGPPAAIANALADAMAATRTQFNETPLSPTRVLDAIRAGDKT